jgi:hypothetical protein
MAIPYYHIDVFTDELFAGNPAGVCILPAFLAESTMQKIAAENRHSETAFVVARADGGGLHPQSRTTYAGTRHWRLPMCSRCGSTRCGRFASTRELAC